MNQHNSFTETADLVFSDTVKKGVLHQKTEDHELPGSAIQLANKQVLNFASLSYQGPEFNEGMWAASSKAIEDYRAQFSTSKAYASSKYHDAIITDQQVRNPNHIYLGQRLLQPWSLRHLECLGAGCELVYLTSTP